MNTKRVLFSKGGELIFISHLDLAHTFVRALGRANMPVAYSSGFNPHPKLVFALPLSVGTEGKNELCDITLKSDDISDEEFFAALSAELPHQIKVKRVYAPDRKFSDIEYAGYTVSIERTGLSDSVSEALSHTLTTVKKTKSGEKEIDLIPRIKEFSVTESGGITVLSLVLCAAGEEYLNPELLMKALAEKGVLTSDDVYFISRDSILFKDIREPLQ